MTESCRHVRCMFPGGLQAPNCNKFWRECQATSPATDCLKLSRLWVWRSSTRVGCLDSLPALVIARDLFGIAASRLEFIRVFQQHPTIVKSMHCCTLRGRRLALHCLRLHCPAPSKAHNERCVYEMRIDTFFQAIPINVFDPPVSTFTIFMDWPPPKPVVIANMP